MVVTKIHSYSKVNQDPYKASLSKPLGFKLINVLVLSLPEGQISPLCALQQLKKQKFSRNENTEN